MLPCPTAILLHHRRGLCGGVTILAIHMAMNIRLVRVMVTGMNIRPPSAMLAHSANHCTHCRRN